MSRYRNIHIKMWASPDFEALSPAKPNGQTCWMHLLTGKHTTSIPGLFSIGPLALAEDLKWTPNSWKKCFKEIEDRGMARADWKARLVYLPSALLHNKPANPNVIRSWRDEWKLLPSCALRDEAEAAFTTIFAEMGQSFADAWASVTRNVPFNVPGGFTGKHTERSVEPSPDALPVVSLDPSRAPSSRAYAGALAAPDPVPASDPERVQGEGRKIQTPALDPHTATRVAWSEAVSAATGGLYPGVGSWPEEDAALAALRADAERAHVAQFGAFDLERFLARLHNLVVLWVTETRAEGKERFTGGWKPSKFVVWFSARQHEPERPQRTESRFGPPTDEELGLVARAQA